MVELNCCSNCSLFRKKNPKHLLRFILVTICISKVRCFPVARYWVVGGSSSRRDVFEAEHTFVFDYWNLGDFLLAG